MKQENSGSVLELLLSDVAGDGSPKAGGQGIVVGTVTGVDEEGHPEVALSDFATTESLTARSIVELDQRHVGNQVVMAFERGDKRRPIILGLIQDPGAARPPVESNRRGPRVEADLDGETLVLSAKREIVLRCGKSSITLTRAGKVLIRGAYLLSRSSGVNRIKGGSVQIN